MARLPSISGERLVRALKRVGFEVLRQQHPTLAQGTLSDILKQTALTPEELDELL